MIPKQDEQISFLRKRSWSRQIKLAVYPCDEGLYLWLTAIVKFPINFFFLKSLFSSTHTHVHHTKINCGLQALERWSLLIGLESERSKDISDISLTYVNEFAENEHIPAVALMNIASLSWSSTCLTNAGVGRDPVFSFFPQFPCFKL